MSTQSSPPRKEWMQAALFRCMWSNSSILHYPVLVERRCCDAAIGVVEGFSAKFQVGVCCPQFLNVTFG